jgi:hypothetical protein
VQMIQPTFSGQGFNLAMTGFPSLSGPDLGRVLSQSIVDPMVPEMEPALAP